MNTRIRMIKTSNGCEDGYTSRCYKEGEIYEVPDHLAKNFIIDQVAVLIEGEKEKQPHTNKALNESDYENKSKPSKSKRG